MNRYRIKQNSTKTKFVIQEEKATWVSRFLHFCLPQYPLRRVWKDMDFDHGCAMRYDSFSPAVEVVKRLRQRELDKDAATWTILDE